jgi:osmotically-inducible protein OsmY
MNSDPELQRCIEAQLASEPTLHAEQVSVRVLDGVVTLTGSMGSTIEQWQVLDTVRAVPGVRGLNDETMVSAQPCAPELSGDIARPWFPPAD